MTDKQIIDVTKCIHFDKSDIPNGCNCYWDGECNHYCYYKKYAYEHQECEKLKQTLAEIIRFFKEDEKFARYSGRPIIFAKPALEKIEKILKENDIKISEVTNE